MRERLLPHPLLSGFLLVVWLLLVNSLSAGAFLLGGILAVLLPHVTKPFWRRTPRLKRPGVLLVLIPRVLWDILVANIAVAWLVLTRRNTALRPAFLEIPLALSDPWGITSLASIITLTPGTVSCQLSEDHGILYVHALDCPDPAAAIAQIQRRYEQPLKELLEC